MLKGQEKIELFLVIDISCPGKSWIQPKGKKNVLKGEE